MNIAFKSKKIVRASLLIWCFAGCLFIAPLGIHAEENGQPVGASTNGIYASAKYLPNAPGDGGHLISIFVHFRSPSTNIDYISPFELEKYQVAKYFNARNAFIGLIELENSSGEKIPLLKTNVNSQAEYPDSYSLKQTRMDLNQGNIGPELPYAITGSDPEAGNFNLPKYFKIKKPGDYQLTVWPKIYKKTETNSDLVKRIDLPPVTIPIKWTGSSK